MAIIIKVVSFIYMLTFALKPFEMMELTNEYLKLIPIKKLSDYKIKHLFMTLVLTIRFVVLYSFFFCTIVNDYIQRFRLAQSIRDQVTAPTQVIKKAEEPLPAAPKTDKTILIDQAALDPLSNPPKKTTKTIVDDINLSLHHEINSDDNKSEHDSINPTPTSSSNNTTSSSTSSITEHSSIDLSTNEPALETPFMDKKINEPIAVQAQLEPYTILSTVPNKAINSNRSLNEESDVVNDLNEKEDEEEKEEKKEEKEEEKEKEKQTLLVPESTVDCIQDTQEEIESVTQKFPMVPSTEVQETTSSPVVQNNSPSEGSVTPPLTSASSSHVSPASHRSNSNSSFKLRSSSLLSALKGGEQKQQQQQIIPQLPEKQVSRFSSMKIGGSGNKKKVSEEEPLKPKESMSTQLKKGLKRFGTKVKHSGKRASKIFD